MSLHIFNMVVFYLVYLLPLCVTLYILHVFFWTLLRVFECAEHPHLVTCWWTWRGQRIFVSIYRGLA